MSKGDIRVRLVKQDTANSLSLLCHVPPQLLHLTRCATRSGVLQRSMAGPIGRLVAQVALIGANVVIKAFAQAYQQAATRALAVLLP